ncbi:MAG: DNA-binding protein [Nitrososphaerales archaeon]|nr:DNA-binding protein [Nitrososphaerales archaeon]
MAEGNRGEEARLEEVRKQLVRDRLLRVLLTSEARQRLVNVKMVKPELAKMVEDYIIQLASSGKIKGVITDEGLKQILMAIQQPKKDLRIRWI